MLDARLLSAELARTRNTVKMRRWMEKEGTVEGGTGFDWEGAAHQNCTLCTFATIKRMLTPGETTFGSPVLHTR